VVLDLSRALAKKGVEVLVLSAGRKHREASEGSGVTIREVPVSAVSRVWPGHARELVKEVRSLAAGFDVLHSHGIWHYVDYVAYRMAREGARTVITTHGMLEPWCLSHKRWKKRIYFQLLERRILRSCVAIHAVASGEVNNIAAWIPSKPIRVIANGVSVEEFDQASCSREAVYARHPGLRGKKVVLFLGRVDPKKGLDILARAFASIASDDVRLVIAGPDDSGYGALVRKVLEAAGVLDKAVFTGMVAGKLRIGLFKVADVFVHSSYSEGFSLSILEAMANRLPVIVTRECNFPEVAEADCGFVTGTDAQEVSMALRMLLKDGALARRMGERGRGLVEQRFSWDTAATEMISFYEQVIGPHRMLAEGRVG